MIDCAFKLKRMCSDTALQRDTDPHQTRQAEMDTLKPEFNDSTRHIRGCLNAEEDRGTRVVTPTATVLLTLTGKRFNIYRRIYHICPTELTVSFLTECEAGWQQGKGLLTCQWWNTDRAKACPWVCVRRSVSKPNESMAGMKALMV